LAYDGSAAESAAAHRLVALTFALKNSAATVVSVQKLTVTADDERVADMPLNLTALPKRTSAVATVAFQPPKDLTKAKHIGLQFADAAGKTVADTSIEPPHDDAALAPLGDKHPAGALNVGALELSRVGGTQALRLECSFAISNASLQQAAIARLSVTPPKGKAVEAALALDVPARTGTGPITVVFTYPGKSLPDGSYGVALIGKNGDVLARAAAPLL
jgi:hypothetical protein